MRAFIVLGLTLLVTLVSCGPPPPYKEKYFDQKLDHFNYAYYKNATYKQRYLIQADSWDAGGLKGPIFFYTGNEGGIEGFYDNCGFIMEIAQQFRGERLAGDKLAVVFLGFQIASYLIRIRSLRK